jgi:16S rRNA processing protein RimM
MEQQYITIGQIAAPHGCQGEVRVMPVTDFPERFKTTEHVYLSLGGLFVEKKVESASVQGNRISLKLAGIDSPEQARRLRGALLQVPRHELWPLQDGAYYHFEIIGLQVVTVDGSPVGEIVEILTTGGNDVYTVRNLNGEEYLVPALKSIVKEIDTTAGRMVIEPAPGLLELARREQ